MTTKDEVNKTSTIIRMCVNIKDTERPHKGVKGAIEIIR